MSDHFLSLIPTDPAFVPSTAARELAVQTLRRLMPAADEIGDITSPIIVFHDCGGNFESVACPACGQEMALDVWSERMDSDYDTLGGFRLAPFAMPCCGAQLRLSDLAYDWPQGFARCALTARNPGVELSPADLASLSEILGCQLRLIRQRL